MFCGPGGLACGALRATSSDGYFRVKHAWANDYDSDIDTAILEAEGGMLVVDVINKKTHDNTTIFWNTGETFCASFKERLLCALRKLTT